MKTKSYKKIAIILIIILGTLILTKKILPKDFSNSIYVITTKNNKNYYYEINDKEDIRKTKNFENDKLNLFYVKNCFKLNYEQNKFFNEIDKKNCNIQNENKKSVKITDDFNNILLSVSEINHDIMLMKIFQLENNYYVEVNLNVNMWNPYKLYKYDNNNKKLTPIYTFDGEEIIGLKLKNKD